jgi:hypothetical protein
MIVVQRLLLTLSARCTMLDTQAAKSQALERELADAKQRADRAASSAADTAAALEKARSHCAKGAALTEELAELAAEGICIAYMIYLVVYIAPATAQGYMRACIC